MDISVTITIADSHLSRIDQVVARLEAAGLTTERVLRVTGIVIGSVAESNLSALRAVPGVATVEEEVTTFGPQ
ncbi:MAG: hypothetical protein ACRD0K_08060 [Egibacteraceae bacterium]